MASSLRSLLAYAGGLFSQLPGAPEAQSDIRPFYEPLSGAPSCPIDGPISCHNNTPIVGDSCCFVHPGGRLLLTQFWDQKVHAGGAEDDWTLHGLWPDLCDGTWDQFCHMTPNYPNVTEVLEKHGQQELIAFMNRYWLAGYGPNWHLWDHEYNKHATCINTLAPACYGEDHVPGIEVVDYFTRASALFRTLDTHRALEKAGIVPHSRRHYPLADVQAVLEKFSGGKVVLRCTGRRDVLHEAWYHYFIKGSLQTGEFVPAQDYGNKGDAGNCAPWVRYPPKRRHDAEAEEDL
ncbi:ribonuclease T2 [Podospora aff. communis PSN243]|uniref:ribonuclease T2 n=1 Tax=Podospora aff. communis PSN243 TaxID=3040156 RepID=A0AAV9GI55_9PEZI|nr:ribonuclease T2 [Podospora aff. communis PSN243]